jgi:hypothetical protein
MLWGCDWNSNLLQSMLSGGLSGGVGGALGWLAKQTKAVVSKALGGGSAKAATLSETIAVFADEGAPDRAIDYAKKAPALDGFYDAIGHGGSNGQTMFYRYDTGELSPAFGADHVARTLRHSERFPTPGFPEYNGQNIRLCSCYTGKLDDGFAQQLANSMDKDVLAPTELLEVDEDGIFTVLNGGEWKLFSPGGSGGVPFDHP